MSGCHPPEHQNKCHYHDLEKRIMLIEHLLQHCQIGIGTCHDKIESLDHKMESNLDEFKERYDALLELVRKDVLEVVRKVLDIQARKNPKSCPVCQGKGGVAHPLTGLILPATCHACKGKGFLWAID